MARGPATFKQGDVTAAVKAVIGAGCEVVRVEIDRDGKIVIVMGHQPSQAETPVNEWDGVYDSRAA